MQDECSKDAGSTGSQSCEGNWKRNEDLSKNLPELKKRLLSRNRIYAFSHPHANRRSNGPGVGENNRKLAGTARSISGDNKKSTTTPCITAEVVTGERKQGISLEKRARKLIASAKEEPESPSLDLWDSSSLHTGTVKRRPGGGRIGLTVAPTILSPIPTTNGSLKFDHQLGGSRCNTERHSSRNISDQSEAVSCPNESSSRTVERIMGNTFTRQNRVLNGNKNKKNPDSFSRSSRAGFSKRIICGKNRKSSSSSASEQSSPDSPDIPGCGSSGSDDGKATKIPLSFLRTEDSNEECNHSDDGAASSSCATTNTSHNFSFRNSPSPLCLPPLPILNLEENFEFKSGQYPTLVSICQGEKLFGSTRFPADRMFGRKTGASSGFSTAIASDIFNEGNPDDENLKQSTSEEAGGMDLQSGYLDRQFTPCGPVKDGENARKWKEEAEECVSGNFREFVQESDRSGVISCQKDTSCLHRTRTTLPSSLGSNGQLDAKQLDLSSSRVWREFGDGDDDDDYGHVQLGDNQSNEEALTGSVLSSSSYAHADTDGGTGSGSTGKMETNFDKEGSCYCVSENRLMTISVNLPIPQEASVGIRAPLVYRHLLLGEQQKAKSDLSCPSASSSSSAAASTWSTERSNSFTGTRATLLPQALVASLIRSNKITQINYVKIYTDWANHYLDKARCKRHIQDLQVDVTDGVILADVVEAVTNQKVPDVVRKPKNSSQMLDNIQSCLVFLGGLGVNLEGITARDIRDGHLKAILSLFFQLSRYKQQQKQQDRDRHNLQKQSGIEIMQPSAGGVKLLGPKHAQESKLPPFNKHGGSTSIPMPASASSTPAKKAPEKSKATLGISNGPHGFSAGSVKPASGSSSRSTSPSAASAAPHSFIPTPRTSIPSAPSSARSSIHEKSISSNIKLAGVQSKSSSVRSQQNNSSSTNVSAPNQNATNPKNNSSMLEKFKFFKDKDKGDKLKVSTGSKRTSSSSGFSSARSERSDSSVSLNSEPKAVPYEGSILLSHKEKASGPTSLPSNSNAVLAEQSQNAQTGSSNSTPRLAIKGFRQKIGKAISSKESKSNNSPKTSRKDQHQTSSDATAAATTTTTTSGGTTVPSKTVQVTRVQSRLDVNGSSNGKETPLSYQSKIDGVVPRKLEKQGKIIESKLKSPRVSSATGASTDSVNGSEASGGGGSNGSSFLRAPKLTAAAAGSRDSRQRYSGTGIPTRNSLIVPSSSSMLTNRNSQSKDELSHQQQQQSSAQSDSITNNINASMSSVNGLVSIGVSNGTGIPKPTAAVKGTTKISVSRDIVVKEAHLVSTANAQNGNLGSKDCAAGKLRSDPDATSNKVTNHKLPAQESTSSSNSPLSVSSECTNQLVTSGSELADSTKTSSSDSGSKKVKNEISSNGLSVAMVSPMLSVCSLSGSSSNAINSMSSIDSSLSQSNSNSSEASVILMKGKLVNLDKRRPIDGHHSMLGPNSNSLSVPAAVESNQSSYSNGDKPFSSNGSSSVSPMSKSDSPASPCPNDVDDHHALNLNSLKASNNDGDEEDEMLVNVTPMEPILRNSPYGYIKGPPGPSAYLSPKSPNANHNQLTKTGAHGDGCDNTPRSSNTMGNRQIYNPYCDPMRLRIRNKPGATPQKCTSSQYPASMGDYDYTEIDNLDTSAAGYLSDGDLLMSGNNGNRPSDGYLSESGASIYSRRIHQPARSKEAPSSHQGINNKHALITEDSFDDSSSLSSGISDLNEIPTDLTSSSVNSELSSPYASLQRASHDESKKKQLIDPQSLIYRVVGSRNSGNSSISSASKKQHTSSSQPEVNSGSRNQVTGGFSGDRRNHLSSNGCSSSSSANIIENHHYQEPHMRSEQHQQQQQYQQNGKSYVGRDKHGNVTVSIPSQQQQQQLHYNRNGSISNLFPSQSSSSSSSFPCQQQQQQHSYSSAKRPDAKTMNNLDSKKKGGIMGVKEEYYGNEMSDRLGREERDGKERYRNGGGHGQTSHNGHKAGSSSGSSDGKRSSSSTSSLMKGAPVSFGYARRSSNSGVNGSSGGGSCVVGKYTISPSSANKVGGSGSGRSEKELRTAEEYKAAQVSLLARLESKASEVQQGNSYIGPGGGGVGTPSVMASPKTRTKVKISGGTQTTNDLHEMNRDRSHHQHHHHPAHHHQTPPGTQQHHQQQQQHPHHHHHHSLHHQSQPPSQQQQHQQQSPYPHSVTSENEYASSTCSRNSGLFSTQSGTTPGYKSLSLTTPTATQLSQSLRERILGSQSLPKAASSSADYAAILAQIQQQQQQIYGTPNASKERMSRYTKMIMNDCSMSDTGGYSNYSEIQAFSSNNVGAPASASPYNWMRHSAGYASSITSAPNRLMGGGSVTEAESLESLSSNSSMAAQLRDARSNSLTQGRMTNHPNDTSPSRSPRLNRSNSIRSTKSEKLYPSMLQRSEEVNQYYSTQLPVGVGTLPSSPLHGAGNRLAAAAAAAGGGQGPYSSTPGSNHSVRLSMSPYSGFLAKMTTKEDEINGSSLSLVSTASSIYSSQEDRQAHEIRKLKRELVEAQEKVQTLTNQLSTNAHVVAAFEQSLSNMTQRLQSLSVSAEQKDSEVVELRRTIEQLRKQSIEAGLTVASMTGSGSRDGSPLGRQLSADSVSSINSISSACSGTSHSHASGPSGQVLMTPLGTPTHHHGTSHNGAQPPDSPNSKKKHSKGKGWLRSSFTKAFSRSKTSKNRNSSPCEQHLGGEDGMGRPSNLNGTCAGETLHVNGNCHPPHLHHHHNRKNLDNSAPGSPILTSPHSLNSTRHSNGCSSSSGSHSPHSNGHVKGSGSSSGICEDFGDENAPVDELKKQLREKDKVLIDIRLEALESMQQLESFKEKVNKMEKEMLNVRQENERLQRLVSTKSLNSSQSSLQVHPVESMDRRLSAADVPGPMSMDFLLTDGNEKDGKRIIVTAFLGCHGSFERYVNGIDEFPAVECSIGTILVGSKLQWEALDSVVRRALKEYIARLDPVTNLGLCTDSISCYNIGEVVRSKESHQPELLPCGYLVGEVNKIRICLKGAVHNGALDALAFETLIPKSTLQRYLTLLMDHGRMILCGPSGTGKSYLARKLGEFIVARSGKTPCAEAIATFSADHKNSKELRQYLTNLAEQCESGSADLPSVIILDNLHHVSSFGEVFNGFLHSKLPNSPIVIGTMSQSNSASAKLEVHQNFRWVLFGNHIDPVKGLLSRYLQRRLIDTEVQNGMRNFDLARIVEWIPKVWSHVNKVLETHNSSHVTIGPRLFLSCPMDVANSQAWFTDLWHYSIVPYIIEAVKEGIQLYGKKSSWEDPTHFLLQTYPWTESHSLSTGKSSLLSVRSEDVGYDKGISCGSKIVKQDSKENDPLMNMLMRLQEAANYSGPQSNDSDTTSLDSHLSLESTKDYTAPA